MHSNMQILGIVPGDTGYYYNKTELIHPTTFQKWDLTEVLAGSQNYSKLESRNLTEERGYNNWNTSSNGNTDSVLIRGDYILRAISDDNISDLSQCHIGFKIFKLDEEIRLVKNYYKKFHEGYDFYMSGQYLFTTDLKYFLISGQYTYSDRNRYNTNIIKTIIIRLSDLKEFELDFKLYDISTLNCWKFYDLTGKIPMLDNKGIILWTEDKTEMAKDLCLLYNHITDQWIISYNGNTAIRNNNNNSYLEKNNKSVATDLYIGWEENKIKLTYVKDDKTYRGSISTINHKLINSLEILYELLSELKTSKDTSYSYLMMEDSVLLVITFNNKWITEDIRITLNLEKREDMLTAELNRLKKIVNEQNIIMGKLINNLKYKEVIGMDEIQNLS